MVKKFYLEKIVSEIFAESSVHSELIHFHSSAEASSRTLSVNPFWVKEIELQETGARVRCECRPFVIRELTDLVRFVRVRVGNRLPRVVHGLHQRGHLAVHSVASSSEFVSDGGLCLRRWLVLRHSGNIFSKNSSRKVLLVIYQKI